MSKNVQSVTQNRKQLGLPVTMAEAKLIGLLQTQTKTSYYDKKREKKEWDKSIHEVCLL